MVDRMAARVLVIDEAGAVLLISGCDPARPEAGVWWITPGGGVEDGETLETCARRELLEETGLDVEVRGPGVYVREVDFEFEGVAYHQTETFFIAHVEHFDADDSGWNVIEQRAMFEHRWWTCEELATTSEIVYPENLVDLVTQVSRR